MISECYPNLTLASKSHENAIQTSNCYSNKLHSQMMQFQTTLDAKNWDKQERRNQHLRAQI